MKNKIKDTFASRKFRGGAYATVISIVVIIMVLLINIIVTELDIQFDASSHGLYTLSETTKEYVKEIEDEINIYYLVEPGNEDAQVSEIIRQYETLNKNVNMEFKDPVLYPQFAQEYVDNNVSQNSIIVVNESDGISRYVDYNDMFAKEFDYNTYSQYITGLDVEGQVTSAIQYVTDENIPLVYAVTGHGEKGITSSLEKALDKANVKIDTLDTLSSESIPEDCSILFIAAPQTDYTDEETQMIKEYLQNGGNAIILIDFATKNLTNVSSLLEYYGLTTVDGIVLESDSSHYLGQYVNNLIPNIRRHSITSDIMDNNKHVVAPISTGIEVLDRARSSIETKILLESTDSSYSKVDVEATKVDKVEGDIDGPFTIGLALKETYNDVETNIIVYGSPLLVDDSFILAESVGNLDIFLNSINYVSEREDTLVIQPKTYGYGRLTLTGSDVYLWGAITVLIIPIFILALGGVRVYRRRKK